MIVVALPHSGVHVCDAGALIGVMVVVRAAHSFCGQPWAVRGGRERAHACLRSIGPVDHPSVAGLSEKRCNSGGHG
jgi:hypothetical protein